MEPWTLGNEAQAYLRCRGTRASVSRGFSVPAIASPPPRCVWQRDRAHLLRGQAEKRQDRIRLRRRPRRQLHELVISPDGQQALLVRPAQDRRTDHDRFRHAQQSAHLLRKLAMSRSVPFAFRYSLLARSSIGRSSVDVLAKG